MNEEKKMNENNHAILIANEYNNNNETRAIRKRETQIKRNYIIIIIFSCFPFFSRSLYLRARMNECAALTFLMRLVLADCSSLSSRPSASLYFIKIYLLSYFRVDTRISYLPRCRRRRRRCFRLPLFRFSAECGDFILIFINIS